MLRAMSERPSKFDPKLDLGTLDDLATRLSDRVPDDLKAAGEDLTENFRAVLRGWFERMDLVTREEFEVQQAVLRRTREKLKALEQKLDQLESD